MKLTFLGTGHGRPEFNRYFSSIMVEHNGYYYLVDIGAPSEYIMKNMNVNTNNLKGIFITHMHADHVDSLASLTKCYRYYRDGNDGDLFLPDPEAVEPYKAWINALYIRPFPENLRVHVTEPGVVYEKYGLKVTAIRTEHISPNVPTYAYMFESDDGKRVLFTGDLYYDYHDYPQITKELEFDAVISELTHMPAEKSHIIFKDTKTRILIFSHVTPQNTAALEEVGAKFSFPHIIATDGFEYKL